MDDLDSSNFDADTNGFSLIDVSAFDDDFLLSSSSDANAVDNQGDILEEEAHVDKLSDLMAVQRPRKPGKCNLRKSLAWDSAFFTSAGVLDAEELSSIMEGAETGPNTNHPLPGIQEELSKSTDSFTTFESDSLTLESLEADLFCDIRASIQRTSKSSISGNDNGEGESGNVRSRKIGQPSSGNTVKHRLASRKLVPAAQGLAASRMLKPTSSSKQVNKACVLSLQLCMSLAILECDAEQTLGKESSLTLPRSPAATGKPSLEGTTASKRMSVGTSRAKSEIHHAGNGKGVGKEAMISKGPRQVDSRSTSQKALSSSRLSSASSVRNGTAIPSSHSSYDSSSSSSNTSTNKPYSQNNLGVASSLSSSENIRKSLLDVRRKIDKNANLPPGSKIRAPSRVPVKGKSQPGECKLSAYVKSASNLSPSVSPASSISEWSIESSSSNATVSQKQSLKHCSAIEDVNADRNLSQNLQTHSNDGALDSHDYQVAKKLSTEPALSQARPGSAKPSGLRLPSPKIGFFDGAKAGTKTPSGSARSRSAIPSNLLKSAAGNNSPSGTPNKAKPSSAVKLSMSAAGRPGTTKLDPNRSHASPKLTQQRQDDTVDLPTANSTGSFPEVLETTFAMGHASPKLIKPLQANIVDLPSGNKSDIFSEVSIANLAKSPARPILTEELQDDIVDLQSGNDSGTFSEVLITTIAKSDAIPILTKQVQDDIVDLQSGNDSSTFSAVSVTTLAKHDAIPILTKQVQDDTWDLESDYNTGTFSEILVNSLAESTIERNSIFARQTDGGQHVDSCSETTNSSSGLLEDSTSMIVNGGSDLTIELPKSTMAINSIVATQTDGGRHVDSCSETKSSSSGLLEDSTSIIVNGGSDLTIELPKSTIAINSIVATQTDGGRHVDSCSETKSSSSGLLEDSTSMIVNGGSDLTIERPKSTIERNSIVATQTDGGKHLDSCLETKNNSSGLLGDSTSMIINGGSDLTIELPKSTIEINSIVATQTDGGRHVDSCLETMNNSSGLLEDSTSMIVNGGSDLTIELPNSISTKLADDYAERLSPEICFDDQPETNSKLIKDNFAAIKEAAEENELPSGVDQVINVADGGPHFICTSSLPDNGVNQAPRTPFAVKNLVSDVVKANNSLTVLTSEAYVKIDAMPSPENILNFEGRE
ncbi:hypothetical protein KSS87_020458 [Heliosperma pusillum]|nr:hypothetical protein KSS87_020458 [Heliosperma pusillum]